MSPHPAQIEAGEAAFPGRHPGWQSGTCVWLIRHGEVDEAWQGRAYGALDVPLSAAGAAQTREVAQQFQGQGLALVVSSTLQRARTLGECLAEVAGVPLESSPALREIERGRWQGLPTRELFERFEADVAGFYADPWSFRRHGGESDADLLGRSWPLFEHALRAPRRAQSALAFALHYNVIRVLVSRALGIQPARSFALRVDPLGAICLRDGPHGFELVAANVRGPGGPSTHQSPRPNQR